MAPTATMMSQSTISNGYYNRRLQDYSNNTSLYQTSYTTPTNWIQYLTVDQNSNTDKYQIVSVP